MTQVQHLLQGGPAQIFLDSNGTLTTTRTENKGIDYGHIGQVIHDILMKKVSQGRTTIHADGPRSVEKEHAHQKRDRDLTTRMRKLMEDYDEDKIKGTKRLYRRLKSVYRAPPDAARQVLDALQNLGWTICRCPHQADCCIARCLNNAVKPEDVRIITKDSDLLVYEASTSITIPVGSQWKTFQKQDLMDRHQLPTPAHLLLLGILTTNDYTDGVPYYGLVSNADIVRTFTLDGLDGLSDQERLGQFKHHVIQYLKIVYDSAHKLQEIAEESYLQYGKHMQLYKKHAKRSVNRVGITQYQKNVKDSQFDHALQAFVMCTEHPLPMGGTETTSSTPDIHSLVTTIIQEVEMKKAKTNWERFSRSQTSHTGPSAPTPIIDQAPPLYKKSRKQEMRHGSRARSRRRQKWQRTKFRSRTDQADRYVPQTVNLENASPVEDVELSGLKPSTPRPYKPKDPATTNEQAITAPVAKKKKKKKHLDYHQDRPGYAALKKSFKSVFATVTLTTGSVKGCLKRATDLTPANVDMVAQRLDMAVSIVNTAKHFVYKMLEMRILGELLSSSPPTSFLEDILDSDWAEIVIGNLLSFVLRDSTKAIGPTANKPKSKEAQAEAVSIFAAFKGFHPGFKAVNPSSIPLGVVIDDLAPKICLAMKLHYKKLPQTIRTKMEKLEFDPALLPKVEQEDEDKPGDDGTTLDDDGTILDDDADDENPRKKSKKIVYQPGHIRSCWNYLMALPAANRPRFCTQSKMADSFIDIREEGLMRILWGRDAGQVGLIWSGSPHSHDWANLQVNTSFGNLIKMLFIGDRNTVRLANKQQTTYGKRSATMSELKAAHPTIYDQGPLARHLTDRINYYRTRHNASISAGSSSSSSASAVPPPSNPPLLPTPPHIQGAQSSFRYALNNFIRTDGHQLQLLAYDLTKSRQAPGRKEFLRRIENQYPTRQSIIEAFGQDLESVAVIGIDPGEVVSGAFCVRLDDKTVVNLLVKRASLYQPTLAFRAWEQEWRRQHPAAGPADNVDASLWTRKTDDKNRATFLPSMHDLENALHSTKYDSEDALKSAQRQYFELEPIIHGFYSSSDWKKAVYQHRMAELSEMDMAVAGVLRLVKEALKSNPMGGRRVLFALGNATFRTGFNLTSVHTTFLRRLQQKVIMRKERVERRCTGGRIY
ncbi:hypothetical protein KI688_001067 [Linnemannia hyalina]|uniref:Uncharacterized protein n=1 Tax=Linnemannia hyalina TaxID=64524 RepID=A0A9P7Y5G6_9FUNG|nr:hypothetical protein KI688_001067 [Linnemannia hyalina]